MYIYIYKYIYIYIIFTVLMIYNIRLKCLYVIHIKKVIYKF